MLSFTNTTNEKSSLPFIFNHEGQDHDVIFSNHRHHHPPTTSTYSFSLPSNVNAMADNIIIKKPCASKKKDRRSKIRTAHGLRDRRVRLSIGIARKFFDLQDTLGFDKASKTLEWLLTKSKASIMELTQNSTTELDANKKRSFEQQEINNTITKPLTPRTAVHNISRESRDKARERARARTRAKMSRHNSSVLFGKICEKSGAQVEESIFIRRKLCFHQNFAITNSKDGVGHSHHLSLPQNWGNDIMRPSFVIDANNLSTEVQVYGKPWEGHSMQ